MSILRYERPANPAAPPDAPSIALALLSLLAILLLSAVVGLISAVVLVHAEAAGPTNLALGALAVLPFATQGATLVLVIRPMWHRCQHDRPVAATVALSLGWLVFGGLLLLELSMLGLSVVPLSLG
ncbi:hypothetical protein EJV47_11420 [Hymenobacter gummosus]|uniref:Uncharacterized protein n=1 Tax=Hymenobacter gummosus TaxID=1776032 RepID=A0A3S0HNW1_9BACT|nr:hypothetical protein [Hymenobacter gummosus]RTQ50230.1 hypothetical protein EJV47_11420 [Hymenobacter gummosus]